MDIVIALVVATIMIALGLLALAQDVRKLYSILFFALTITLSGWIISSALTNHYFGDSQLIINIISNRLAYFFGYVSVLTGLLLTYVFPIRRAFNRRRTIILLIGSAVVCALSLTKYVAGEVTLSQYETLTFKSGVLLPVYVAAFLVVIAILARNLNSSVKKVNKTVYAQAKLVLLAFVACALIGLTTNVILPLLGMGIEHTTRFAPLSAITLVVIIAYAIIRHGLFDIKLAAVRTVAYILSITSLAVVYYAAVYLASTVLFQGQATSSVSVSPLNILLALILAFIFQPIKRFFDRTTDRVFFRDRYKADDFYARLSGILTTTTDLRTLLRRASEEVATTLKAQQAFFYIKNGVTRHVMVGTKQHAVLPAGDIEQLDEYIKVNDESVIVTDLLGEEHRAIRRLLSSHKVELLMPLVREKTIIGYLALGSQQGTGYVKRDVKTLNMIASELIIAIQNARSVQEVRDINASLEQRIGLATAELRMSNARLRRVDAAKDEFLSMASHQLRTPLTSIKGYLSMVLEGDVGRVTKAQRQVLEEAFTSSERMVHLIHDFLNVSRLQTGKFVLEKDMYDVTKMIREEVSLLQRVAASRDMAIDYSVDIEQLVMKVDETKLRQVVVNFIDNAMYYSPAGSTVTVKLTKTSDRLEFRVDDKGIGVPLKEQAQLFQRFYRATNARKQRPDGTGVGLYLAKKIITAHGGDVRFSSKPGKGSTFGFWLPLEDESDELDDKPSDDKSNNKSD